MASFLCDMVTRKLVLLLIILIDLCRPSLAFNVAASRQTSSSVHLASLPTAETSDATSSISFETPPMRVYIEDTDAYGIMYNGNYLRSYDRALHLTTINRNLNTLVTSQHEGWSIVSMGQQKFVSSPALGGDFVVQATLKESADNWEIWDMQMTSPDGATLYNKVTDLQIAKPTSKVNGNIFSLQHIDSFSFDNGLQKSVYTLTFTVYRDEIDAHWTGHLPLRNVLNLFERARTNMLGGPNELRRLQQEDGILVVVIGIGACSLIDEGVFCCPGQQVDVETACVVKRRGMIVECWQTLKSGTSRLAQGKVNLMMLDAKTLRPTSKLPTWVQEKLGLVR